MVVVGQVGHHRQVVRDGHDVHPVRDVVCAREDQHGRRVQRDDIGQKAAQHLPGDLPADSAVDEVPAREVLVQPPAVGNRVAQEHHARRGGARRRELEVIVGVALDVVAIGVAEIGLDPVELRLEVLLGGVEDLAQFGQLLARLVRERHRLRQRVGKQQEGPQRRQPAVLERRIAEAHELQALERQARGLDNRPAGARQVGHEHAAGLHQLQRDRADVERQLDLELDRQPALVVGDPHKQAPLASVESAAEHEGFVERGRELSERGPDGLFALRFHSDVGRLLPVGDRNFPRRSGRRVPAAERVERAGEVHHAARDVGLLLRDDRVAGRVALQKGRLALLLVEGRVDIAAAASLAHFEVQQLAAALLVARHGIVVLDSKQARDQARAGQCHVRLEQTRTAQLNLAGADEAPLRAVVQNLVRSQWGLGPQRAARHESGPHQCRCERAAKGHPTPV